MERESEKITGEKEKHFNGGDRMEDFVFLKKMLDYKVTGRRLLGTLG
jgi:hypothetical protein